ncbi:hypothetical protein BDV29DRAFT_156880 [Aspergillus leporis]|uniref:AMP-dependent synthetase/ligase domain-containing protein n=1 Tax=Aspergillus leporis TaxID=41062 RepID=A0A5N5X492_9EURO|nr:hypothetical protein BDV29DRAFT_156880 [Aspergillus leporis]
MVGLLKAKELLIRGRIVSAKEALAISLVNEIAENPKVRAEQLALELASLPRAASSSLKMSLERAVFPNMEIALHEENFADRKKDHHRVRDINTALREAAGNCPTKVFLRSQGQDITFQDFGRSVAALAGAFRRAYKLVLSGSLSTQIDAIVDHELFNLIQDTGAFTTKSIWIRGSDSKRSLPNHYDREVSLEEAFVTKPATISAFLYTSGTTGKSKLCIISHEYFIIQATLLIEGYKLQTDDVPYCPSPLFHADATALTVIPATLLGATAALAPKFTASRFWDEIRETGATVYDFMGATLALIYKQPPSLRDRDHHVRLAWGVPIRTVSA